MKFLDVAEIEEGKKKKPAIEKLRSPSVSSVLDLEAARARFGWVEEDLDAIAKTAHDLIVEDDKSLQQALELAGQAKILGNKIETQRKAVIDKPNSFVKTINSFCKIFYDSGTSKAGKINGIEKGLKRKIGDYQNKIELERRKKEKEEREARETLQKKMNEEAEALGIEAPEINMAPPAIEERSVMRSESGTSAFLKRPWKFEIEDPSQVPHQYCSPNHKKLKDAVGGGIREIPGVRIFQDIQTNIRVG